MTPRDRVINALNHQPADKVPVDFGSTPVTGISASLLYNLQRNLGFQNKPIRITDPYQMLGEIDDDLKQYLNVDVTSIMPRTNLFGYKNTGWKNWNMFDGTPVLVPGDFNTETEPDGSLLMYPQGDSSVTASAKMPKNGYYFDTIIRQNAIDDDNLDVNDNLEEFELLGEDDLRYIETETDKIFKNTEYAIIGNAGTSALGDIALVPAPMLKYPKGIRDIEEWYISTRIRQSYLKELFDKQSEIALENFKLYKQAVGEKIVALYLCGTDFGTQLSPFCSEEMFRDLYLPYYRKMTDWIHKNTKWKVFKHTCGSIEPLINSFIDAGFDILNPVQCSAVKMDPQFLKKKYGDRIVFWGGGVDTQYTLPFGTPEEVKEQVRSRIRIFNENGGFIFNTIHNLQAKIPVKNFIAMVEAIKEFR